MWSATPERETCPGVFEISSVTMMEKIDFSLSQQIQMIFQLLTFTQMAKFSFIHLFKHNEIKYIEIK